MQRPCDPPTKSTPRPVDHPISDRHSGPRKATYDPTADAIGDLVDRRRFLLVTQGLMLAAAAQGGLAIAGLVTPWSLLSLLFAVGTGQALTAPTWQTLQPEDISEVMGHSGTSVTETVYRHEIRPALTTGAEAMNRIFATKKRSQTA